MRRLRRVVISVVLLLEVEGYRRSEIGIIPPDSTGNIKLCFFGGLSE
jgi:hypothetical protein